MQQYYSPVKILIMKSLVRFSLIAAAIFFLSGCVKSIVITTQDPIVGSWTLNSASEGDASGWTSFATGVESGVFNLYANGSAQYSDAHVRMEGRWSMVSVSGGYYDEYGSFYNGQHQQMELHLNDATTHSSIDLSFDYVNLYGNQFVATYFNGSLIDRYFFSK